MKDRLRVVFGAANVGLSGLVWWGVFRGLPTRWWPVDVGALVVILLSMVSGAALLANHSYATRVTRWCGFVLLAIGLALFAVLALTATWLYGVYGPVGKGGAAVFGLVTLLVIPYLIVFPAAELLWVGSPKSKST